MTKERLIEILYLIYKEHNIGDGICDTLDSLFYKYGITRKEEKLIGAFLHRYFRNKRINSAYYFSDEFYDYMEESGTTLRKNIILDAIGFVTSTGITK